MKKLSIFIVILFTIVQSHAQQLQTSSMYDLQGVFFNPSMAGVDKSMVGASYRTQWSGISGNPKTATVFGSIAMPKQQIGLGGYLFSDKTGPTSKTGISLAFAKHIPMHNGAIISLGIEAKGEQYALDKSKLSASLGADPALLGNESRFVFDAGFGVSYTGKKLQLGASVSQLVQSKLDFYTGNLSRNEQGRLYRHYYFHGLYKWTVDESTVIIPNFVVTYLPNAPTELQAGVRVEHNELFWWGIGLRSRQSWMLSAGLHIKKMFTIGYSFDLYQTPLSVFDAGGNAHEILLRYNFPIKP